MDVKIWNVDSMKAVCMSHSGPYEEIGGAWKELMDWVMPKNLIDSATKFIGVYYDNPEEVAPEKLRSEACMTVSAEVPVEGKVKYKEIEAGKCAVVAHLGPYEKLGEAWMKFYTEWLPQSGETFRDDIPCFEQYLNCPETTPAEQLVTLLYMPLK